MHFPARTVVSTGRSDTQSGPTRRTPQLHHRLNNSLFRVHDLLLFKGVSVMRLDLALRSRASGNGCVEALRFFLAYPRVDEVRGVSLAQARPDTLDRSGES